MGIKITEGQENLKLNQKTYVVAVLEKFERTYGNEHENNNGRIPYREALGSLLYLSNKIKRDISFAVGYRSRKLENPSDTVKRIMRYLIFT